MTTARPSTVFATIALSMLAASELGATEYCVVCAGPDQTYACSVAAGGQSPAAKMRCIAELARQGGHSSCSVSRQHAGPCPGPRIVLDQGAAAGAVAAMPQPSAGPAEAPPRNETSIAKSVPEAAAGAEGAAADTRTPIEKAGAGIGGAAKKSWDCLASLFKSC